MDSLNFAHMDDSRYHYDVSLHAISYYAAMLSSDNVAAHRDADLNPVLRSEEDEIIHLLSSAKAPAILPSIGAITSMGSALPAAPLSEANLNVDINALSEEAAESLKTNSLPNLLNSIPFSSHSDANDSSSSDDNSALSSALLRQKTQGGLLAPLRPLKKIIPRCRKNPKIPKPLPKKSNKVKPVHTCLFCGTTTTPEWRRGPDGQRSLCNACGLRFANLLKREKELPERESRLEMCRLDKLLC
eukprot:TRINITY_DN6196_c0_g1_i1.p1 TRINITY_DN6196_c0_g1~~TRINITY_DN6196_c0_g1_i1.p1  ORF type:complete len:262 (+),score=82.55 TRINITY_DN6196_c0_g1_i1:57-788(+)